MTYQPFADGRLPEDEIAAANVWPVSAADSVDTSPRAVQEAFDNDLLELFREYFQTKVNNLSGDEMAEGPFEDPDEEEFGDTWEKAAERIDARGGLRVFFRFADQED